MVFKDYEVLSRACIILKELTNRNMLSVEGAGGDRTLSEHSHITNKIQNLPNKTVQQRKQKNAE